jgi:hypothetical protein
MKPITLTDELKEKLHDDEFYYGELSKMALSSSAIKLLLDSPKTYQYVTQYGSQDTEALRAGWLFHTAVLQPDVFEEQIFIDVQSKNTKLYKEAKDTHGRVFTIKEKNEAERMADALLRNQHAISYLKSAQVEIPTIGTIHGYPFRGKADILNKYSMADLKSTSDIKSFPYSAKRYGYDIQVYIYCQLFNVTYDRFTFIVVDKGSLDIGIFTVSEEFYLAGEQKVLEGIDRYRAFFEEGQSLDDYYIEGVL